MFLLHFVQQNHTCMKNPEPCITVGKSGFFVNFLSLKYRIVSYQYRNI